MKRALGAVAGLVLAAVLLPAGSARAVVGEYVAIGDSFTAGPLIPVPSGSPAGCLRSNRNYPALVARELRPARFADVSCNGARIAHLTEPQNVLLGRNPAQFDALTPATTLVTIGIGGNDVGFGELTLDCGLLSLRSPVGAPCKARYGGELERRVERTAPRLAAALQGVRRRAPGARVLVVGYLRLLPAARGCWPLVPVARGDVAYLDALQRDLNRMLAEQARAHGAGFVDAYTAGTGHDMCAPPGRRWVEGILLSSPAAPIHPNAAGMRAVAAQVLAAARQPTQVLAAAG